MPFPQQVANERANHDRTTRRIARSGPSTTLKSYLVKDWLPHIEREVERSTFETLRHHVANFIVPHIGLLSVNDLQPQDIVNVYSRLLETPRQRGVGMLSRSTVQRVHGNLHWALQTLVRTGRLDVNPAQFQRPKQEVRKVRGTNLVNTRAARVHQIGSSATPLCALGSLGHDRHTARRGPGPAVERSSSGR
jgi:Phage integrase, N-terminal SAM-like domain